MRSAILVMLLIVSTLTQGKPFADCIEPSNNLLSWWSGDGDAADIRGENGGTLEGDTTFADGLVGQSFQLDGVGDHVNVVGSRSLNTLSNAATVELWIKAEQVAHGSGWMFARRDPGISEGLSVYIKNSGVLTVSVRTTTSPDISGSFFSTDPGVIHFGEFQHVAVALDTQAGTVKAYVNGSQVELRNVYGPSQLSGNLFPVNQLFFGRRQSSATPEGEAGGAHFKGLVDEITLYSVELTQDEIREIYNAGSEGKCKVQILPFGRFSVKLDVEASPDQTERFEMKSRFILDASSDGIDILTEDVIFRAGNLSWSLAAGSFSLGKHGDYKYENQTEHTLLRVKITPLGGDEFEFKARGDGFSLSGTPLPLTAGLMIGNEGAREVLTHSEHRSSN